MKKSKTIFVAGCGGMLGESIYNVFNNEYHMHCSDINVNETWLNFLDFRNYTEYDNRVKNIKPDYLFHIGAYTDLEYCELNKEDALETNFYSVKNAVKIANNYNCQLIFISSAGVFDGTKNTYYDEDLPVPIGHYAKTKVLSEEFIKKNSNNYLIIRPGWMMGGGPKKDKKFVNKIIKQIKNNTKTLNVVSDKLGTPTYTYDFANNLKLILKNNLSGIFNLVCEGQTSRLEVAHEIIKILNLQKKININEVETNFFKNEYFAKRPFSERLENKKLNDLNLNIMRNWKICLNEYLINNFSL